LRRAEGGAKNFGVFRVKNQDFTPKNHIFQMSERAKNRPRFKILDYVFKSVLMG
jgi:hypothetical protein